MKKKLFASVLALFMFIVLIVGVRADASKYSLLGISFLESPKASNITPAANTLMYAGVTDPFDFSRVVFAKTGGGTMNGKGQLKKIVLSDGLNAGNIAAGNLGVNAFNENWFTAYCLDGEKMYPEFSILTYIHYLRNYAVYNILILGSLI